MWAIRKLAAEAADKWLLAHELPAAIGCLKSVKSTGVRDWTWLSLLRARAPAAIKLRVAV
jgi:hypothetical protein